MPNPSLDEAFATLDLKPGCAWDDVRHQYKRLAFTWHPDRHINTPAANNAEERTKAINAAFDILSTHYQRQAARLTRRQEVVARTSQDDMAIDDEMIVSRHRRFGHPTILAAVAACVGIVWLLTQLKPGAAPHYELGVPAAAPAGTDSVGPTSRAPLHDLKIEVGDTRDNVLRRSGTPTRLDGDVWYYDDARVRFRHGIVTSVQSASESIKTGTPFMDYVPNRFSYGSSKEEVRRIQGAPAAEGDTQWVYGPSRVYFRNGYVSGWYSSPLQPLKINGS